MTQGEPATSWAYYVRSRGVTTCPAWLRCGAVATVSTTRVHRADRLRARTYRVKAMVEPCGDHGRWPVTGRSEPGGRVSGLVMVLSARLWSVRGLRTTTVEVDRAPGSGVRQLPQVMLAAASRLRVGSTLWPLRPVDLDPARTGPGVPWAGVRTVSTMAPHAATGGAICPVQAVAGNRMPVLAWQR